VEDAGKVGSLDARVADMASRALDMRDLKASAIMIPRDRVVSLAADADREEIARVLAARRHTRMPVFRSDPANVIGYVALTDLVVPAFAAEPVSVEKLVRPVHFAPESTLAPRLLADMRQQRTPMAIIVDEAGDLAGLVTMQDIAEEVIGEIVSEDRPAQRDLIKREADGTAVVAAAIPTREVNRALGLELPEGEHFTTLGGLAVELAGRRIPKEGAKVKAPDGTEIVVLSASARRVHSVKVCPPRKRDADG
jgi:putative hemolysin